MYELRAFKGTLISFLTLLNLALSHTATVLINRLLEAAELNECQPITPVFCNL